MSSAYRRSLLTLQRFAQRQYTTATAHTVVEPAVDAVSKSSSASRFGGALGGFLAGMSVTSGAVYFYLVNQYNNSNELVVRDVLSLARSVRILEEHVRALEQQAGTTQTAVTK